MFSFCFPLWGDRSTPSVNNFSDNEQISKVKSFAFALRALLKQSFEETITGVFYTFWFITVKTQWFYILGFQLPIHC